ncbi:MAG TPA: hypothetical protein DC047_01620 [Blastocatellia bacterium]|nr:hypothetical protein [Blastocatellia bacterium]
MFILTLVFAAAVAAQDKTPDSEVQYPTEAQLAANKWLEELLKHPTFITLRLVSGPRRSIREDPTDAPAPYLVGDLIGFQLFVTQSLPEVLKFGTQMSAYYEYRPELYKNGNLLPFSAHTSKHVDYAEKEPSSMSERPVSLISGKEYPWTTLSLDDWYDRLGPGHYQLSIKKRFSWDGDWVQSNAVLFDVQPRKVAAPILNGITIEMVPENFQGQPKQKVYRLNADTFITVVVLNSSNGQLNIPVIDLYYGNRPQLFKDAVMLPYKEDIKKLVSYKDENPGSVETSLSLSVEAKTRSPLMNLNLNDWYGPLQPGHYKLINQRRFEIDGPWTAESTELWFDIFR